MRVLDGEVRKGFLKQQASGGLKRAKSSVEQTAGESHIDNTVLPYVRPPPPTHTLYRRYFAYSALLLTIRHPPSVQPLATS